MKKFLLISAIALSFTNSYAANVINLGPQFNQDMSGWRDLDDEQKNILLDNFESKNQFLYDTGVYRKGDGDWTARKTKRREIFFKELPNIETKMNILFDAAERLVTEKEFAFKKLFPDLSDNIPVVFMPSIFSFNGRVMLLPEFKRNGLLMGVDFISYRSDNLDVLFSHEFFHAYHFDKLPDGSIWKTMATPLWLEGFATYVSGLLNPTQSTAVLLMDNELANHCNDHAFVKTWAKEYLVALNSGGEQIYDDWFSMGGQTKPTRRGYCLGFKVVEEIAKSSNLNEMVVWTEDDFSKEI